MFLKTHTHTQKNATIININKQSFRLIFLARDIFPIYSKREIITHWVVRVHPLFLLLVLGLFSNT